MHHTVLVYLSILIFSETALLVCALIACLRAGSKNPIPAMRDYLIVRAANVVGIEIFLSWPGQSLLLSHASYLSLTIYYYWYWISAIVLFLMELRVAAGAMEDIFRDLPGLQGLFRLASRWIAITGVIFLFPLLLAVVMNRVHRARYMPLFHRWFYLFSAVELVPVVFALLVCMKRKVRWRSTTVLILVGFVLEPLFNLVGPWPWTSTLWLQDLGSILGEIVCCAAGAVWTICYLVRQESTPLPRPTPAMLMLEELAREPLRKRHPAARPEYDPQQGAQPWPKYRRDA
jgi:hypothetical protein